MIFNQIWRIAHVFYSFVMVAGGFFNNGKTASDGRHSATPLGDATIGRFTKIGWATIASSNASSSTDGSKSPNSSADVLWVRLRHHKGDDGGFVQAVADDTQAINFI
jgi:hypothetical protein